MNNIEKNYCDGYIDGRQAKREIEVEKRIKDWRDNTDWTGLPEGGCESAISHKE